MRGSRKLLAIGWFVATLLLAFYPGVAHTAPGLSSLCAQYADLSVGELHGEYNSVVEFHDNLRAKISSTLQGSALTEFTRSDDQWCNSRQEAILSAFLNKDKQAIINVIILENLRNGTLLEKLP